MTHVFYFLVSQVVLFGFDRFDVVNFLESNKDAFQHLFIKGYNNTLTTIYTKDEVYTYLKYAHSQVKILNNLLMETKLLLLFFFCGI